MKEGAAAKGNPFAAIQEMLARPFAEFDEIKFAQALGYIHTDQELDLLQALRFDWDLEHLEEKLNRGIPNAADT